MHAKIVALSAFFAVVAAGGYAPPTNNLPNLPNLPNGPDHPNLPNGPNHPNLPPKNDNNNGQNKPVSSGNKCNVGELQCCNSVQSANSDAVAKVCESLGIAAGSVTGLVGLTCDPVSVIGVGGNSW